MLLIHRSVQDGFLPAKYGKQLFLICCQCKLLRAYFKKSALLKSFLCLSVCLSVVYFSTISASRVLTRFRSPNWFLSNSGNLLFLCDQGFETRMWKRTKTKPNHIFPLRMKMIFYGMNGFAYSNAYIFSTLCVVI
jgi:hypothetical protein